MVVKERRSLDKPIRVLNLFTIMNRGGAETMVMNYYRNIDRSKVQYDFMVHRQERGAYDDEIEALGGRIYRMSPVRPWTAGAYREEVRKFYQEHPEYKIIHSHMSELGYYDFIEAKKAGVLVRICHAHNRPHGMDLKSPIRWYYKKRMLPYTTDMFMCGEESGEWLYGKKNKDKFIQMNNAIDAEQYSFNPTKRKIMREKLRLREGQLAFVHVGRFDPQKNHTFLIDIFAEVQKNRPDARLFLIGDDSSSGGAMIHEKVQKFGLKEKVVFLGVRNNVSDLLQAMDVFIFPSLFEGLSVASVEAQASGLPILISDKIPLECKKTDLVEVVSLADSPEFWAEKVIESSRIKRRNTISEIKAAGFDIKANANWLEEFYLNASKRQ